MYKGQAQWITLRISATEEEEIEESWLEVNNTKCY
jgi:hypothetical protein